MAVSVALAEQASMTAYNNIQDEKLKTIAGVIILALNAGVIVWAIYYLIKK